MNNLGDFLNQSGRALVMVLISTVLVLGFGPVATADATVIQTSIVSPVINGRTVWTGNVPVKQIDVASPWRVYSHPSQGNPSVTCVTPSNGISFQITDLWPAIDTIGQYSVSLNFYGRNSAGAKTFAGSTLIHPGVNQVTSSTIDGCANPFDTKDLTLTTSVAVIGTILRWTNSTVLPFEYQRAPGIPYDLNPSMNMQAALNKLTVSAEFPIDKDNFPETSGFKYGIAQSDTYDEMFLKYPTNVQELGEQPYPLINVDIEKIAPLITNQNGYYTLVAKAVNAVGVSKSWSLMVFPLKSSELLAQFKFNQEEEAAAVAAAAAAELKAKQKAGIGKKYKNCSSLNAIYPGGISRSSKAKNLGKTSKKFPLVNQATYKINIKLDVDHDGIVCEK